MSGVGRITIHYPAHLYSLVLVPTVIPQFSFMAQCFFVHKIRRKSCLQAALIYSHPLLVLHSTPYLFWKVRNGTCQFSVYMLFLSGPFKPGHVLYIVRKVFSRQTQRRRNRENRFGGSRDIQCTSWEYWVSGGFWGEICLCVGESCPIWTEMMYKWSRCC